MKYLSVFVLLACLAMSAMAQKDAFVETIREHVHTLTLNGGQVSGAGGILLNERVAESQFVLLGEQHGLAEVQAFGAALYDLAHQHGYRYFAVETDPVAAARVELMASPSAQESEATAFFQTHQMAIPFFYSQEGMEMARAIHATGGGTPLFWGLDQVFVVEPRLIFTELVELAPHEQARNLASDYLARAHKLFGEAMGSGDPSGVILMQLTSAEFEELRSAFKGEQGAVEMIDQMQLSQEIYRYWYDGQYYLNNSVRSDLMKRLFRNYYYQAVERDGAPPKVVFKFGSNHCVRGLTRTHIYDLGSTVAGLADMNATRSLHLRLTGARGTAFNALQGPQAFDAVADWHPWLQEALDEIVSADRDGWVLVDLRPLRHLRLKDADEEIKSLVFGFDLWIIIPAASPVTPFR
ncbi:MAG: hypothetical protein R3301_07930 [Saprospiraceae bacterium]|nr:hypothetical protein [Saprospiraceae bacterium]